MPKKNPSLQKTQAKKDEETYFVSIRSPLELRRQLLECTRKTIFCLQNYQKIMLIRQQKIKEMESLKSSLKELMYLNKKLNEKLPEYNYEKVLGIEKQEALIDKVVKKSEKKDKTQNINFNQKPDYSQKQNLQQPKQQQKNVTKEKSIIKEKSAPREKSELEKLEESLALIEGKLKNLNKPQ